MSNRSTQRSRVAAKVIARHAAASNPNKNANHNVAALKAVYSNQLAAFATHHVEALLQDYALESSGAEECQLTVEMVDPVPQQQEEEEEEDDDGIRMVGDNNNNNISHRAQYQGRDAIGQFYTTLFEKWSDLTDFEVLQVDIQQPRGSSSSNPPSPPARSSSPRWLRSLLLGPTAAGKKTSSSSSGRSRMMTLLQKKRGSTTSAASTMVPPSEPEEEDHSYSCDSQQQQQRLEEQEEDDIGPDQEKNDNNLVLVWSWKCPSRGVARATNRLILQPEAPEPSQDEAAMMNQWRQKLLGRLLKRPEPQKLCIVQHTLSLEPTSDDLFYDLFY